MQISNQFVRRGVADDGSHRNFDFPVVATPAVAVAAHSVLAARRFVLLLIAQIEQGRHLRIRHSDHIATVPAIATIGPAARHVLLAAKADAAAPAVAGDNANLNLIDKFHD